MATRTQLSVLEQRKQPKQARSKELVEAVLTAATRVFDKEGLTATTNRVAEEAGVSVGSLYQYFPNKESLLAALAERHVDRATALIRAVVHAHQDSGSVEIFIKALISAVLKEHRDHAHLRPLLRTMGSQVPELQERFTHCIRDAQAAIVQQLERLHPDVPNPKIRASVVSAAVDGVLHSEQELPVDDALEHELIAMCTRYLEH